MSGKVYNRPINCSVCGKPGILAPPTTEEEYARYQEVIKCQDCYHEEKKRTEPAVLRAKFGRRAGNDIAERLYGREVRDDLA